MKRRAIQVCVVFFPTPIPASAHVHTHARVNAHTRIHLMLNAPKRGTFKLQALDPSLGQSVSGSSSSSSRVGIAHPIDSGKVKILIVC